MFIVHVPVPQVSATARMRNLPRFGRSSTFADIFVSKDNATGYIFGLLFAGIMVLSIFFTWTVVLWILKCLGEKRVGFLSGSSIQQKGSNQWPFYYRIFFVLAAYFFIDFSILFVTNGLTNIHASVVTIIESASNINVVMTEVDDVIKAVKSTGSNSSAVRESLVSSFVSGSEMCLVQQQEELLADPSAAIGRNISEIASDLREALINLGNFQTDEIDEFTNSTEYFMETSATVEETAANVEIGDWQSLVILIQYIATPILLVIGVVLASMDTDIPIYRCILTWIIHPIIIFQIIFAYLLAAIILITASANADFCSGGEKQNPDQTVLEIFHNLGWTEEDLVFRTLVFYVGQCTSETPFGLLDMYRESIQEASDLVVEFADESTGAGTAALSDACSTDVALLEELNAVVLKNLQNLVSSVETMLELLKRSNIIPLYTIPIYDGSCSYSITGITWAWASFVVVASMGLLMITLRSSWQLDMEEELEYGNDMASIYGEFTVDQGLGGEDDAIIGEYAMVKLGYNADTR